VTLSRAGNRQVNRALHIMAVVRLRNPTEGRAYYDRKVAAGKTPMEAMRALKRRLSDIVYRQMIADARAAATGPGGHVGAATGSSAAGFNPSAGTSEKSLPARHRRPYARKASPFPWSLPALSAGTGPQTPSSAICLTTARAGAHYPGAGNDPLDTEGSQIRSSSARRAT
jgi:hypothetical protein